MSRVTDRPIRLLLVQLAAAIVLTPLTAAPQTNDRIVLNVTVTTDKGDAILDLSRENFSVNIDKRPQTILLFDSSAAPASIGILIDTSGSLHDSHDTRTVLKLRQNLKTGLERFVQLGHPGNEYFVMTFNNDAELLQDWTSESESVTNKLDALELKGQTALYDSITKAVAKVMGGRNSRHVLILVSDGHDSYSRSEPKHVRETLKRSDVVFYFVGMVDPKVPAVMDGPRSLDEVAINSGGRHLYSLHFADNPDAFIQAFESFALELRSQYQLVISAEEAVRTEKWHKLNVSVARNAPSGRPQKLIVRTRKGYYR